MSLRSQVQAHGVGRVGQAGRQERHVAGDAGEPARDAARRGQDAVLGQAGVLRGRTAGQDGDVGAGLDGGGAADDDQVVLAGRQHLDLVGRARREGEVAGHGQGSGRIAGRDLAAALTTTTSPPITPEPPRAPDAPTVTSEVTEPLIFSLPAPTVVSPV